MLVMVIFSYALHRPGVVDLPASNGAENTDAITLPEIFHDFEIFENAME